MPGSMLMVSASITFQDNALDSPIVMVCGSAEKETSGGRAGVPPALIVIVTEASGVPKRKTVIKLMDRNVISFSNTTSAPVKKSRRGTSVVLKRINPLLIGLSGVFLVMVTTPSPGSSTLNVLTDARICHLPISKDFGPNTVWLSA